MFGHCFVIQYIVVCVCVCVYVCVCVREREMVALLKLSSCYPVAVSVLCLFLTVLLVGLQCVIVAFAGHTH